MPSRKVPFFNYPALYKMYKSDIDSTFEDVMSRGAFILQKDLEQFENSLAQFIGCKHAIGVANGTDGLIIALRAAGIAPGDEVILPSHTYIASAASVHFTGGVPVLVECGPDHMVDVEAMASAVTEKTRFLMPVQVNGRTCNMDEVMALAKDKSLVVIEDAAQALGSKFRGQCAGTFGRAGMFSFYPAKVLGCFGDGGAVVTNDDDMAEKMKLLRDHGRDENGEVVAWGLNSRLDNMQAALLGLKLKTYKQDIDRRRQIAKMYNEGLKDLEAIDLPPSPFADDNHFDVYQNYELEADQRDPLKAYLADKGIGTIIQWAGTPVHQFKALGFKEKLPLTDKMTSRFLMLPMNVSLSDEDVQYVIEHVRKFYDQ